LISDHLPVQIVVVLPPRESVQFYVELAIIGGSFVFFASLILIGSAIILIAYKISDFRVKK
jgi:hypothetical protein